MVMTSLGLALPGPPPVIAHVDRAAVCVEMVKIKKYAILESLLCGREGPLSRKQSCGGTWGAPAWGCWSPQCPSHPTSPLPVLLLVPWSKCLWGNRLRGMSSGVARTPQKTGAQADQASLCTPCSKGTAALVSPAVPSP